MKSLDRYLRRRRIRQAAEFLRHSDVVIDIGCADGAMFEVLEGRYGFGYGVEPSLSEEVWAGSYVLLPGVFPDVIPPGVTADRITMLAVLEHLAPDAQQELARGCVHLLKPGGQLIITVPSPRVDGLLHVLEKLRLVDGMSMHEHYGFQPADTPSIFPEPHFQLVEHRRFQFGLNNLFVFERTRVPAAEEQVQSPVAAEFADRIAVVESGG